MFTDFREKGRGREREILMVSNLQNVPQPEIEPTTYICALTRNQTLKPLEYRMMLQSTELPGQGSTKHFFNIFDVFNSKATRLP